MSNKQILNVGISSPEESLAHFDATILRSTDQS